MYKEKFDLSGRTAVITGGGRGIGLACAEALAENNANVVICDVNQQLINTACDQLSAKGYNATGISMDVTSPANVTEVARQLNSGDRTVDILIANAGIAIGDRPSEALADDDWLRVLDVNLNGVFWNCRAFGKYMLSNRRGSIVAIGSMCGFIATRPQRQASYNASKAAVHQLIKSLAAEWAPSGVRVNAVAPTYITTPMNQDDISQDAMRKIWLESTPMGRVGHPDEVASVVSFLASEAASLMTGSIVAVDGGYTIW